MVTVTITFYGALTKITGEKITTIEALTLEDAITTLASKYGDCFEDRIYDKKGNINRFVNIYINGKDIRFLNYLETKLKDRDGVSIVPAVGGG